jgi:glycosyltransferase involved in cell wall biosynthesis
MKRGPLLRVAQLTTDARGTLVPAGEPNPVFGTAPEALLEGFSRRADELEVHVLSCVRQPVRAPPKLADNIFFHSLVVPKPGWRAGFAGCVRAVRQRLRQIQPHLVHGQGTERDCALSAAFSGFPNLITIHGNMQRIARLAKAPPFSHTWMMARLERFVLPRTHGVICITRHTDAEVARFTRRRWLLPNPVDRSFFAVAPQPVSPPVAVCVASIGLIKNQNQLLQALDPIGEQGRFVLAFHGILPPDAYGAEFSRLLQARPWAEYRGFASRAELRQVLARAALLILPSIEENCPMVVLEAMAAGVPVAASNVGGVPDLIEDGVTGMLFNPADRPSICSVVEKLLQDSALRAALAERAKARALATFEPGIIAGRHLEIYCDLLGQMEAGVTSSRFVR